MTLRYEPREGDVIGVRRILESCGQFRPGEIAVAEELVQDRLRKKGESEYHFVFADVGGEAGGFACYGPISVTVSSFDLYWIAVHSKANRSGVGSMILRDVFERSRLTGGTRMFAETSSGPIYAPARRFYLKHGFRHHCTVPDFYALGDDKLIFGRAL